MNLELGLRSAAKDLTATVAAVHNEVIGFSLLYNCRSAMDTNPYETPETLGQAAAPEKRRTTFRLWELLVVVAIIALLVAMLLPAQRSAREAARRMACQNNLKQISLALQNYHEQYGCLPPAYTVDEDGKPLHSWRTLILPFVENVSLYNKIDLSKPWDHPENQKFWEEMPKTYRCPSGNFPPGKTGYLAIIAPGGCFAGRGARAFGEITDKHHETLMVIEVHADRAVPWMSPQDADEETVLSLLSDKRHPHPGGAQASVMDGSVEFLKADMKPEVLRAMITTDGND